MFIVRVLMLAVFDSLLDGFADRHIIELKNSLFYCVEA